MFDSIPFIIIFFFFEQTTNSIKTGALKNEAYLSLSLVLGRIHHHLWKACQSIPSPLSLSLYLTLLCLVVSFLVKHLFYAFLKSALSLFRTKFVELNRIESINRRIVEEKSTNFYMASTAQRRLQAIQGHLLSTTLDSNSQLETNDTAGEFAYGIHLLLQGFFFFLLYLESNPHMKSSIFLGNSMCELVVWLFIFMLLKIFYFWGFFIAI